MKPEHMNSKDENMGGDKRAFQKRKVCRFCANKNILIDYKDSFLLKPLITERYRIVPRRISGTCSAHQRDVTRAIKRARHLAIVPYTTAQW